MKTKLHVTPLSTNKHLLRWVEKRVDLCQPAAVHWVDGSQEEYHSLCAQMVAGGTFIKLNQKKWPNGRSVERRYKPLLRHINVEHRQSSGMEHRLKCTLGRVG